MNWRKLSQNKCPKCFEELDFKSDKDMMMCTIECGFMISVKRMKEICMEQAKVKLYAPTDNFEALQNLGNDEETSLIDEEY